MSDPVSLLPANATPWEKVVSLTSGARYPLPTDLPREFWHPDKCPEHLLGWLALSLSVDVWDDAWPPEKKRHVIKRSIPLHRIKGTEAALREYLLLAGYPVVKFVAPPQGFFAAPDLSEADYEAWFKSLPEIRLFRLHGLRQPKNFAPALSGTSVGLAMFAGPDPDDEDNEAGQYVGFAAGDPLDLSDVSRREAVLIEGGVETKLGIDGADALGKLEVETFYIPRQDGWIVYAGSYAGHHFAAGEDRTPDYVASVRRTEDLAWWNLASHGRAPVRSTPQLIAQKGPDSAGMYAGGFAGQYATSGDHDYLIWHSWRLAARGRLPELSAAASFADVSRVSIDAYTAEITIDARRPMAEGLMYAGLCAATMYATESDQRILDPAFRAVNAARAARDRILIDSQAAPDPNVRTAATINDLIL